MATKTPKTQFDSMWDEKKDAEAAANRFRRL
jgi:predicted XRE-type DNA-binding protein